MSQGTRRSDLLSLKRELLDSARLDVQPLPASVRKRALLAATIAGVTSATAGGASAAGASAILGGATSVATGLAKLGGIGALLVSVGTATYYATEGVWDPPPTTRSNTPAPEVRTSQRGPSRGPSTKESAATLGPRTLEGAPAPSERTRERISSPSTPELRELASPGARAGRSTSESHVAAAQLGSPRAAAVESISIVSPKPPPRIGQSTADDSSGSSAPTVASPEGVPALWAPLPTPARNIPPQTGETLNQELALLDSARARLAAGDANDTLFRLDQYLREFPSGALLPEAMFLRVQALSQAGQHGAAARVGRDFLLEFPTSPHADRVRSMIQSERDGQNP